MTFPAGRSTKSAKPTFDEQLLAHARRLRLNLSEALEAASTDTIRQRASEAWLKRNCAALIAYNEHVEKDGVFSNGVRLF